MNQIFRLIKKTQFLSVLHTKLLHDLEYSPVDYFYCAFASFLFVFFQNWNFIGCSMWMHGNKNGKQSTAVQRSQIVCGTPIDMIFIDCLLTFDEKLMSCLLWTPFITSVRVKWTAVIRVIRFSLSAVYQITHRHVTAVKHHFCFTLFKNTSVCLVEIEQSEGKRRERSTTVDRQTNQNIAHVSKCQIPTKISQINSCAN